MRAFARAYVFMGAMEIDSRMCLRELWRQTAVCVHEKEGDRCVFTKDRQTVSRVLS